MNPRAKPDSPGVSLRVALRSDVTLLLPMMREFNRLEEIDVEARSHQAALETLIDGPELGRVFVFDSSVESRTTVVGYAVLTFNYDLEYAGRDAFLTELFVVESARGTGCGRQMLRQVELAATALDVKAIHLMVRPENTIAQRLYSKSGYAPPRRLLFGKELAR